LGSSVGIDRRTDITEKEKNRVHFINGDLIIRPLGCIGFRKFQNRPHISSVVRGLDQ
jgi:hypothetical protein